MDGLSRMLVFVQMASYQTANQTANQTNRSPLEREETESRDTHFVGAKDYRGELFGAVSLA